MARPARKWNAGSVRSNLPWNEGIYDSKEGIGEAVAK